MDLGTRARHCLPEIVTVGSSLREQGCVMVAAGYAADIDAVGVGWCGVKTSVG
jgi:hypothetical protein